MVAYKVVEATGNRAPALDLFLGPGQHVFYLLFPTVEQEETLDMSQFCFNIFNAHDPVNQDFAVHLGNGLGKLLGTPPPYNQFGCKKAVFPWEITNQRVLCWRSPKALTTTATPPLPRPRTSLVLDSPFYKQYFLPPPSSVALPFPTDGIELEDLEGLRPHHHNPSIILTLTPYGESQSWLSGPFTLCSDLVGDSLLTQNWSLPGLALFEPGLDGGSGGGACDLIHNPMLRLEGVQTLAQWNFFTLVHAGTGAKIPVGPNTKIWLEINSY